MNFSNVLLVMSREFNGIVRRKVSLVVIVVISVFMLLGGVGFNVINHFIANSSTTVAVTAEMKPLAMAWEKSALATGDKLEIFVLPTEADPLTVARKGKVNQPVKRDVDAVLAGSIKTPILYRNTDVPASLLGSLNSSIAGVKTQLVLQELHASAEQTAQVLAKSQVEVRNVFEHKESVADPARYATTFVMVLIMIMFILSSAGIITQGIVEEKASRVVEVLLSTVKPKEILLGKIIGLGIWGIIQTTVFILSGLVALFIAGDFSLQMFKFLQWESIILGLAWLVCGYGLYSVLFAALSSLVSRQEDLGAVIAPLSLAAVVPFYLAIFLVPNRPDFWLTKILSYIPFFSPYMMPVRFVFRASWVEEVVAFVIMLAFMALAIPVAGRVYQYSILRMGGRVKLRDALRAK